MVCDGSKRDVMGTMDEMAKLNVLKSIKEFKLAWMDEIILDTSVTA